MHSILLNVLFIKEFWKMYQVFLSNIKQFKCFQHWRWLITFLKEIQIEKLFNCSNISRYYCFYCIVDQINVASVSIRDFFQKSYWTFEVFIYLKVMMHD